MLKKPYGQGIVVRRMHLFLFLLICMKTITACSRLLYPDVDIAQASTVRVGDPDLNNQEYALRLLADGWPVDTLNTAALEDYLDDDEKNIILAHNLVRYDPEKFARLYVTEYINYFQGREFHYPGLETIMLTREGDSPATELYFELLRARPVNLLYPSAGLSKAARSHLEYISSIGIRGHGGQGGLRARIEREGTWQERIAENIAYGNFSAHDAVLYMLIDDLVIDRSHRKIILQPGLHKIGVARGMHPAYPTGYSYVINYAYDFTPRE